MHTSQLTWCTFDFFHTSSTWITAIILLIYHDLFVSPPRTCLQFRDAWKRIHEGRAVVDNHRVVQVALDLLRVASMFEFGGAQACRLDYNHRKSKLKYQFRTRCFDYCCQPTYFLKWLIVIIKFMVKFQVVWRYPALCVVLLMQIDAEKQLPPTIQTWRVNVSFRRVATLEDEELENRHLSGNGYDQLPCLSLAVSHNKPYRLQEIERAIGGIRNPCSWTNMLLNDDQWPKPMMISSLRSQLDVPADWEIN